MAVFLATVFADGEIGLGGSNHAHTPEYPQALIASLAIWMRGRGVVPVNPKYITKDIAHLLSDSGARWIMCEEAMFEKTEGICFSE